MLKILMRRQAHAFGKRWQYDSRFLEWLADASPRAFMKLGMATAAMEHRERIPAAALAAARIEAVRAADCGECLALAKRKAREANVPAEVIETLDAGNESGLPLEIGLAVAFAQAVVRRDLAAMVRTRTAIVSRWGPEGLASLALTIATASVYPTLKRSLSGMR